MIRYHKERDFIQESSNIPLAERLYDLGTEKAAERSMARGRKKSRRSKWAPHYVRNLQRALFSTQEESPPWPNYLSTVLCFYRQGLRNYNTLPYNIIIITQLYASAASCSLLCSCDLCLCWYCSGCKTLLSSPAKTAVRWNEPESSTAKCSLCFCKKTTSILALCTDVGNHPRKPSSTYSATPDYAPRH